jgi:hypothetical protein
MVAKTQKKLSTHSKEKGGLRENFIKNVYPFQEKKRLEETYLKNGSSIAKQKMVGRGKKKVHP